VARFPGIACTIQDLQTLLRSRALAPAPAESAIDLVGNVAALRDRLTAILGRAERSRNLRVCLLAIREAARLLELHGRLRSEIAADGARVLISTGMVNDRNVAAIRERIASKLAALSTGVTADASTI
jgi:hypothetical protein